MPPVRYNAKPRGWPLAVSDRDLVVRGAPKPLLWLLLFVVSFFCRFLVDVVVNVVVVVLASLCCREPLALDCMTEMFAALL
jgi:hypothetical protein